MTDVLWCRHVQALKLSHTVVPWPNMIFQLQGGWSLGYTALGNTPPEHVFAVFDTDGRRNPSLGSGPNPYHSAILSLSSLSSARLLKSTEDPWRWAHVSFADQRCSQKNCVLYVYAVYFQDVSCLKNTYEVVYINTKSPCHTVRMAWRFLRWLCIWWLPTNITIAATLPDKASIVFLTTNFQKIKVNVTFISHKVKTDTLKSCKPRGIMIWMSGVGGSSASAQTRLEPCHRESFLQQCRSSKRTVVRSWAWPAQRQVALCWAWPVERHVAVPGLSPSFLSGIACGCD